MYNQPIKAFDNVKMVFAEVMETNHSLMSLAISDVIKHIKVNLEIEVDSEDANDIVTVTNLLKRRCNELAHLKDSPNSELIRAQAYINDQYICSDIFSVLMKHYIYLELLKRNVPHYYKNVVYVLINHLGVSCCYKNDKMILSELFQCALYIYLINRKKYEIKRLTAQGNKQHSLDKEITDRCVALQNLMVNCSVVQYEIEQDHIILTEETLVSVQQVIEKEITEIGGIKFLELLHKRELNPYYDKLLDRYCIHRNKNIAGLAHNEVPVNFLILLALKTLKSVEPGMPVDFLVEERYKRILKMARDFLLVLQLASPSVLEDVYVTPANLNAYICNNMMFDKMVIPVQYNVKFLLDVMKYFFYPFDKQFVGKKYTIRTYIHVARKILEADIHTFDFAALKKLTKVSKEELNAILDDITIDADKVNAGFKTIINLTNSKDYPLIKLNDKTYYFFDAHISGIGFYRALYNQMNQMVDTITDLNGRLGIILENYVKDLLQKQRITYITGKYYLNKGNGEECDVIIQDDETICGMELKYTLLNKDYEVGDDVSLYSTLGKGMIKAQRQLLKHRMDLIQRKSLTITDEANNVNTLTHNKEKIISISVCFSEYRFLTSKIVSHNIMNSIYYGKIGLKEKYREKELESFYIEQKKIKKLLNKAIELGMFGGNHFRPFQYSLFLSLQQIYLSCKLCKNVNELIDFFNNQLFVVTGTFDYYAELLGFINSKQAKST